MCEVMDHRFSVVFLCPLKIYIDRYEGAKVSFVGKYIRKKAGAGAKNVFKNYKGL